MWMTISIDSFGSASRLCGERQVRYGGFRAAGIRACKSMTNSIDSDDLATCLRGAERRVRYGMFKAAGIRACKSMANSIDNDDSASCLWI